jgi:hypothetical protein
MKEKKFKVYKGYVCGKKKETKIEMRCLHAQNRPNAVEIIRRSPTILSDGQTIRLTTVVTIYIAHIF